MKDKLLSVYANNKEVYYVKEVQKEPDKWGKDKAYAVFDSNDNIIHAYSLDVNAYIDAIQRAYQGNNGKCEAYYLEEQETLLFEDYKLRLRIKE